MENDLPGRFDQAITKEKPTKMRVAQSARGDAGALRLADQRSVEIQAIALGKARKEGISHE